MLRSLCIGLVAAGCLLAAVGVQADAGATLPAPTSHAPCEVPSAMNVSGVTRLEPNCIYTTTVTIQQGGAELDCQGSVIDPGHLKGYAVLINSAGKPMRDVIVRNCIIRNSNAIGIVIAWREPDKRKVESASRDEIYQKSPQGIQILNTRIENANGAGIYVDDYVSGVTISKVSILRSAAMAVYLEHSSRNVTIEDSLFENNSRTKKREALAIDSSSRNIVRNSVFRSNGVGGIFLYKNCFEHASTDPNQVNRWQGADHNLIEGNLFEDEKVGVWIASRQSRDLRKMDCGNPYYGSKFVLDHARNNTVRGNVFRNVTRGVVVEDDSNIVADNVFEQAGEVCIQVGSKPRSEILRRPVERVTLSSNRCALRTGESDRKGVEFVHGAKP